MNVTASRLVEALRSNWSMVADSLRRPYKVTISMVVLVSLVPVYLVIAERVSSRPLHVPELALDRIMPVQPAWALVYGALYLFLIVLPVLVVREEQLLRRTVQAYLMIWIVAYVCFLIYPTIAPRPPKVIGSGFAVWGLRSLYGSDPPYNCFPSLHVAHSFVSAFACYRVHRRVGVATVFAAALVGFSTLFTKQHYILDVIAGVFLAGVAYVIFLRNAPRETVPQLDQRLAPVFAVGIMGAVAIVVGGMWAGYQLLIVW